MTDINKLESHQNPRAAIWQRKVLAEVALNLGALTVIIYGAIAELSPGGLFVIAGLLVIAAALNVVLYYLLRHERLLFNALKVGKKQIYKITQRFTLVLATLCLAKAMAFVFVGVQILKRM